MDLWDSPQLSKLNPKVVELLIATVKHLYSNEKLIESKVAEFFKLSAKPVSKHAPSSHSGSSTGVGEPPSAPSIHPSVDPLLLQQLCVMGFSRSHAEEALIACANDLPSAMDWILNHPASSSTAVAGIAVSVCPPSPSLPE